MAGLHPPSCDQWRPVNSPLQVSDVARLTKKRARANFAGMCRINPIRLLTRAWFLALVGFLMAAGSASAHNVHALAGVYQSQPQFQTTVFESHARDHHGKTDASALMDLSVQPRPDDRHSDSSPCSKDEPAGHPSGGCCTVACHVALAAPAIDPVGDAELPSPYVLGLADMLIGRSSYRTERPPKLT